MAYQLTEWVQKNTPNAKGADKCVLYALAHRIPFGQSHWICMAYELSEWTGIPERTLRDCCKRLSDAGYLAKEGKGGRKKDNTGIPSKFTLVGAPKEGKQGGRIRHVTESKAAKFATLSFKQGGEICQQEGGEICRQERGESRQQEAITNIETICVRDAQHTLPLDLFCQKFRDAYPRSGDPEAVDAELAKALELGEDPRRILKGVDKYEKENVKNIEDGNLAFLKQPENWVRKRCWRWYDKKPTEAVSEEAKSDVYAGWINAFQRGQGSMARLCPGPTVKELLAEGLITPDQCRAVEVAISLPSTCPENKKSGISNDHGLGA